jgi:integrase
MARGFTDIAIRNLRPGDKRREVRDEGCEGLYVIIQPSGAKSYAVRYRFEKKPQKLTLGSLGSMSLKEARKSATTALDSAEKGTNPTATKQQAKRRQKIVKATTLASIAEQYFKLVGSKLRTGARLKAEFERLVNPTLGGRPITEIKKSEIVGLLEKIESGELKNIAGKVIEGGPVAADRTHALIRAIFNWHATRTDDDFRPPIVKRAKTLQSRERVLSDDEIRKVWNSPPGLFSAFVKVLLLTAARRNEVAPMKWNEISSGGDWLLPADRNKTKRELVRPLCPVTLALIETQRRDDSQYVFASAAGKRPMSAFGRFKRRFDKQTGTSGWTLHDLRRTARTLMSRADVDYDIAERCLGHVIGGVRGVYDRHKYHQQMRRAYDALAALIERIAHPPEGNVTTLPRKRRA